MGNSLEIIHFETWSWTWKAYWTWGQLLYTLECHRFIML